MLRTAVFTFFGVQFSFMIIVNVFATFRRSLSIGSAWKDGRCFNWVSFCNETSAPAWRKFQYLSRIICDLRRGVCKIATSRVVIVSERGHQLMSIAHNASGWRALFLSYGVREKWRMHDAAEGSAHAHKPALALYWPFPARKAPLTHAATSDDDICTRRCKLLISINQYKKNSTC